MTIGQLEERSQKQRMQQEWQLQRIGKSSLVWKFWASCLIASLLGLGYQLHKLQAILLLIFRLVLKLMLELPLNVLEKNWLLRGLFQFSRMSLSCRQNSSPLYSTLLMVQPNQNSLLPSTFCNSFHWILIMLFLRKHGPSISNWPRNDCQLCNTVLGWTLLLLPSLQNSLNRSTTTCSNWLGDMTWEIRQHLRSTMNELTRCLVSKSFPVL